MKSATKTAIVEVVRRAAGARGPRQVGERYTYGVVNAGTEVGNKFKDHGLTLKVVAIEESV